MRAMATSIRLASSILTALAGALALVPACGAPDMTADDPVDESQEEIVGGNLARTCQWPSVAYVSGCTATLIHPRVLVSAAHCIEKNGFFEPPEAGKVPHLAYFGESPGKAKKKVAIQKCVPHPGFAKEQPGTDVAYCVLKEAVDDIPIVPLLMGCERSILKQGQEAVLVGFGDLGPDGKGGTIENPNLAKRIVKVKINAVSDGEVDLGTSKKGACEGDSGGPAFVKLADGTWRVFGATHGLGQSKSDDPCTGTSLYTELGHLAVWLQNGSGFDITPCTYSNGHWHPSNACNHLPMEPDRTGGSWSNMCGGGRVSGPGHTCGPAIEP